MIVNVNKRINFNTIITNQTYAKQLCKCYKKKNINFKVVDIFVVPDYIKWLKPCIDPELNRHVKTEFTQLQWKFEKVSVDANFPLGVRTTYRAFSQDSVFEIIKDKTNVVGFSPRRTKCSWFPKPSNYNASGGMYLLQHFPRTDLQAAQFLPGGRKELDEVVASYKHYFHKNVVRIQEWDDFAKLCPATDKVADYLGVEGKELYIPMKHLFTSATMGMFSPLIEQTNALDVQDVPTVYATDSVVWSNRGVPLPMNGLINPRMEISHVNHTQEQMNDVLQEEALMRRTADDYKALTNSTLMNYCRRRGLPVSGKNKGALVARLVQNDQSVNIQQPPPPDVMEVVVPRTVIEEAMLFREKAQYDELQTSKLREFCKLRRIAHYGSKDEVVKR